jgi:hypothetical protein
MTLLVNARIKSAAPNHLTIELRGMYLFFAFCSSLIQ